jgi:pilus assembly protein TadC
MKTPEQIYAHKGAPLMDAIDEYATAWEVHNVASMTDLLRRVKVHMVGRLSIQEKYVTDKDLAYFVRRMGVSYLIGKIHSMTTVTAEHMLLWANKEDAQ